MHITFISEIVQHCLFAKIYISIYWKGNTRMHIYYLLYLKMFQVYAMILRKPKRYLLFCLTKGPRENEISPVRYSTTILKDYIQPSII